VLGCAHAVRLLGEPDTSQLNGQPTLTAIHVLAGYGRPLPVYAFVLRQGEAFVRDGIGEVVGTALESLAAAEFPASVFAALAQTVAAWGMPTVSSSLLHAIITGRKTDLYPLAQDIITRTRHDDLHRYGVLQLAAARESMLTDMLYTLARTSPTERVMNYLEAVELTSGDERDELIAALEQRL
jgi:hypothetical protein